MNIIVLALRDLKNSKDLPIFNKAAKKLKINISFYKPSNLIIEVKNNQVFVKDIKNNILKPDGVINWLPYAKYDELGLAFKAQNTPFINNVSAVRNCRNKLLTNIILKDVASQPHTEYYYKTPKSLVSNLNLPIVYKKKTGTHGYDAKKFEDITELKGFVNKKVNSSMYLQNYINNYGYDLRIVTVGNKVIGGIKKTAETGEFRTHKVHGGKVENFEVPNELKKLCIKVSKKLDLDFAGIDIMPSKDKKMYCLEVNSVPGISLLKEYANVNLAEEILLYLKVKINGQKRLSNNTQEEEKDRTNGKGQIFKKLFTRN